uniref:Uncharacterized protein n=1 Tax=Nelumbo nucifera TaxID=4432 RepID=A0A822YH16_NELNU|nr:TPA_asm: hypothetical protein HUJ06_009420 [Nelumbo nucifera]
MTSLAIAIKISSFTSAQNSCGFQFLPFRRFSSNKT